MAQISYIYIFDGTLEGLLTSVFEWFERKPGEVALHLAGTFQPDAFVPTLEITSQPDKANRVWKGLQKRVDKRWIRRIYCANLAERSEIFNSLFKLICYIFENPPGAEQNYGHEQVLAISQIATKVEREKHRMEAFIRFQHTADGHFYCGIEPDFNVIPLIVSHFKNRYADQQWIIYDLKRKYGIFYNLTEVEEISISIESKNLLKPASTSLDVNEKHYAELWKDYFRSTNIVARKNTKLHVQHVPRRYWKYLTEKH